MSQLPDFLKRPRKQRVDAATVPPPAANPVNEPTADMGVNSTPPMTRPRTVNAPAPLMPAAPPAEVAPASQVPAVARLLKQPVETQPVALRDSIVPHASEPLPPTFAEAAGVDESGATQTRPRFADPAGRLEKQIAYEGAQPAQDHNGRLKSTLKEIAVNAALGFMQGGLPGAVRGSIVGGAVGAIHPAADEERQQEGRVYKWQQTLADLRGNEKRKLDLGEQRAGIRVKNAQADALRAPKPTKPDYRTDGEGRIVEVKDGRIVPLTEADGTPQPGKSGLPPYMDVLGPDHKTVTRHVLNRQTNKYEPLTIGDHPAVVREVSPLDAEGVSANVRATAKATKDERDYQHGRGEYEDDSHEYTRKMELRRSAQADINRLEDLKRQEAQANGEARAMANDLRPSVQAKAKEKQAEADALHNQALALHEQIKQAYPEDVEAGMGMGGFPYAKFKTAPPRLPHRPAGSKYVPAKVSKEELHALMN